MALYQIIAVVLMTVPIAIIIMGLTRFRTRQDKLGLVIAAAGNFLLFVLGWIASGQFLFALMVSLALVAGYCRNLNQSGVGGSHAVGAVAAVVACSAALLSISIQSAGCAENKERLSLQDRGKAVTDARIELIGKALGDKLAGSGALVITSGMRKSEIKRFKRGVRHRFDIVAMVRLPLKPPGPPPPGVFPSMQRANRFDELLDGRDDYDLVICFAELPERPQDMQFWQRPEKTRPDFVLVPQLLRGGQVDLLRKGWLTGIVIPLPIDIEELSGPVDEWDKKYEKVKRLVAVMAGSQAYVDLENLAEIEKRYPGLLR